MATTSHIATSARIDVSALNEYIKKKIEPIERHSIFYGALKSHGRVSFGHDGQQMEWRPRFRRRRINAGAGNPASISMPNTNTKRTVTLPWRSYDLGESVTKFERLATQGKSGWFKILDDVLSEMASDFMAHFGEKFYLDGNATATNQDIHGLESWYGNTGSCVTGSYVANPNDTYAGQSTALGVTGSWTPETSGGWPTGTGYTEYHWWSPMIVDYNNSGFAGSTANWSNQWQFALNYCLTYLLILQNVRPDICIMAPSLHRQAKDSLAGQQRFTTTADSKLTKLGFQTLQYEGLEIATEYGVPQQVAYVLPWEKLEFRSMQKQLVAVAQDTDITTSERLIAMDCYGNFLANSPGYTGKLEAVSAAGT